MNFKNMLGYAAIIGVFVYIYSEYTKVRKNEIKITK
jgi:hypothetical protein